MISLNATTHVTDQVYKYVTIIGTCTLAVGLLGNIAACVVISRSRSFRTLTGFYLLSLSIADLLILLTGASYIPAHKFGSKRKILAAFYVSEWICQTSAMVSTLTVTTFTVERYLAICHPFFVQSLPKKSRVKKIIISIWSTAALLALLPVAQIYIQEQMKNNNLRQTNECALPYVVVVWATLCFFVPMSLISVMYVLIWLKLKKSSNESPVANRADTRTLMMFIVIVAVFCVSWGSYHIQRILSTFMILSAIKTHMHGVDAKILVYKLVLVKYGQEILFPLSSALNPVIYLIMSEKFREAFKDLHVTINRNLVDWSSRLSNYRIRSNANCAAS